jgi:hypothetical protein
MLICFRLIPGSCSHAIVHCSQVDSLVHCGSRLLVLWWIHFNADQLYLISDRKQRGGDVADCAAALY